MTFSSKPRVVLIGGPDIDARLSMMNLMKDTFDIIALGTHPHLNRKFLNQGFQYIVYPLHRGMNPFKDVISCIKLMVILRHLKPAIVHTFDTKPCVWGRIATKLAHVPIVIGTLPGLGALYANNKILTHVKRFIYENLQKFASSISDLTIFQNSQDFQDFVAHRIVAAKKAKVIAGSGIDTAEFDPSKILKSQKLKVKRALGMSSKEIVVTMISRIIRSKGVMEFAAAAERIKQVKENVQFLLVGPEDQENPDQLNLHELDRLKKTVTWVGERKDIHAILAITDIFVFPSAYREGIPRVLLEAASMELPIITTDVPGCNEVVENRINGFFVPLHNAGAIAQKIIFLTEHPEICKQFGRVSRKRVIEKFDLKNITREIELLYLSLLENKKYC